MNKVYKIKGTHDGLQSPSESVVLEYFDATELIGAPFTVILHNSVKKCADGTVSVPDPGGLVKAVAQLRSVHPAKLSGSDLKFMRSAIGAKASEIAEKLDIRAEHLSRLETNTKPLQPKTERLFRAYVFVQSYDATSLKDGSSAELATKLSDIFNKITPCRLADESLVFSLCRSTPPSESSDGLWDGSEPQVA